MKAYTVPFTFEVGKFKIPDSLTVFAKTPVEAEEVFNTIVRANTYLKVAYKEGWAVVNTQTSKLKIGKIVEG